MHPFVKYGLLPAKNYLNPHNYKKKPQEQNAALRHLHPMLHKGASPYSIIFPLKTPPIISTMEKAKCQGGLWKKIQGKAHREGVRQTSCNAGAKGFSFVVALSDE
jgi:hypothetical protein